MSKFLKRFETSNNYVVSENPQVSLIEDEDVVVYSTTPNYRLITLKIIGQLYNYELMIKDAPSQYGSVSEDNPTKEIKVPLDSEIKLVCNPGMDANTFIDKNIVGIPENCYQFDTTELFVVDQSASGGWFKLTSDVEITITVDGYVE